MKLKLVPQTVDVHEFPQISCSIMKGDISIGHKSFDISKKEAEQCIDILGSSIKLEEKKINN